MKNYLMSLRPDVWELVVRGYVVPEDIPSNSEEKKQYWDHAKYLNTLKSSLSKKVLAKVLTRSSAKQLWEKLGTIYVGDSKVKGKSFRLSKHGLKG